MPQHQKNIQLKPAFSMIFVVFMPRPRSWVRKIMKNLDRHLFLKEPAIFIPFQRHRTKLWQDILLYRGELARCADLLAFQLGKEILGVLG
jgi:hypothetical protein